MSRSISLTARESLNAEQSGEVWVFLLTITHEQLEQPIRLSTDPTTRLSEEPLMYGTVSRGDTFEFLPADIQLPEDAEDVAPAINIVFDNITRGAIPLLRSVTTPPTVSVELVLASDPDTVELGFADFDLVNAQYDANQVTIDITINALANEPYPAGIFTPGAFPGLF